MPEPNSTIVCQGLTKFYGSTRGIEDLDLTVHQGEIFGFLGPNGAGKTTTIRMLMGLIRPTRGRGEILGMDAWKESVPVKLRVGNIPGDVNLYGNLKVGELLDYIDRFRPGPDPLRKSLIKRLSLDPGKKVKSLSRGNRQKVAIVLAMMHDPDILVLDEPTLGLDPLMQHEFYKILEEFRDRGKTVFLSSHILSEVEHVCERVGVVRNGRLVDVKAISELARDKIKHMEVIFAEKVNIDEFKRIGEVLSVEELDNHFRITLKGDVDAMVKELARHQVEDLIFTQPSLEDFFLSFYGGTGEESESEPA